MTTCANCRREIPSDKSFCPNCGTAVTQDASWPPAPTNSLSPTSHDLGKLITGKRWGDLWIGFIGSWLLLCFLFLGLLFAILLGLLPIIYIYFGTRYAYPQFARGVGFGLISFVIISLGTFIIYTIVSSKDPIPF